MLVEKNSAQKSKQHTVYKNKDGVRVPGTTTITGVMEKPALVPWANKLGLQGIEVGKYVDDLATIGTLAHYLIECHIRSQIEGKKIEPDLSDYTPNQVDSAENCFIKFIDWESKNKVVYLKSELGLVSETYQFGGTVDAYAIVNCRKTLLDFKSCKGIYSEHFTQVAGGYSVLLIDNGLPVEDIRIIRVGRTEEEGKEAEERQASQVDLHVKRFHICRELYEVNKLLNRK